MSKIYFSLAQAEFLVKKSKKIFDRVIQLRDEITLLNNTKIIFDAKNMDNLLLELELNKNFHEKNLEMFTLLADLVREGCIIRNLLPLEVDFYSKANDKDIFLCFKKDDEGIMYWHDIEESYKQRKPIRQIQQNYYEKLKDLR